MSEGRRLWDFTFKIHARGWGRLVPRWFVRMQIRSIRREIARIERELSHEFGVRDTAAPLQEIESLLEQLEPLEQILRR